MAPGILAEPTPTIVGIDHGFSFPVDFLRQHMIANWEEFLAEFCKHWPAHEKAVNDLKEGNQLLGDPNMFRLTDRRAPSAKSVFRFGVEGEVATSTHAGIPWLKHLRSKLANQVYFWPFDGFNPTPGSPWLPRSTQGYSANALTAQMVYPMTNTTPGWRVVGSNIKP